jgi:four helix bundle protein
MSGDYRNLIVWKKAMELVKGVYTLTENLPETEKFGLISQIRRSAISIPSNIAEGKRRGSDKDFKRFLLIAFGSGAELETQIEIVKMLNLVNNYDFSKIDNDIEEVMKMLNGMINKI